MRNLAGFSMVLYSYGSPAWCNLADSFGINGSLRSSYFQEDKSFAQGSDFTSTSLWITFDPDPLFGMRLFADARTQVQIPLVGRDDRIQASIIDSELREGYLKVNWDQLDLKVGRQINIWGRADKINPTDIWSARDFTFLATDDEDQRLGAVSARLTWTIGQGRFISLWQPEWRSSVFPSPEPPFGIIFTELVPRNPELQAGLKYDYYGEFMDWSVCYAHVINQVPDLRIIGMSENGLQLGFHHGFIDVFGVDGAASIGGFGFRGEIAYTQTDDQDGRDPLIRNSDLFFVAGSDRTFFELVNINLQYLYKHAFDFYTPDYFGDQMNFAVQQNLSNNQVEASMHGFSSRVGLKTLDETMEAEIATIHWFSTGGILYRPKATYTFSDHVKTTLGAEVFSGPTESFFGRLKETSSGFLEIRLIF